MRRVTLSACLLLIMSSFGLAVDREIITKHLKSEIIGPHLAMAEVQAFTEARVPRMPEVKSRDEWEAIASRLRRDMLDRVVFRGHAAQWREGKTNVQWLEALEGGEGYRIKKLRYEALPGFWIPALLYEPTELSESMPVVMNVNGHDRKNGKAAEYKQTRCINQAKRGMIALNVEWIGMGQLQAPGYGHYAMNQLDLCGTSGLAPFYLSMKRGLDVLLAHKNADSSRVAVAGLSGGGWQTIFISALDTRVTLSNPVAGYSSFITRVRHLKDMGDSEQTPCDMATVADYTHLTAMLAPRVALLTYNKKDNCCFESPYALPPLLDAAKPIYELYDKVDRLHSHVNEDPGTHNFGLDNRQALYRVFGEHFYAGSKQFDAKEIDCKDELKTFEELEVEVPEDNESFNSLALKIAKTLPRNSALPKDKSAAITWQSQRRQQLEKAIGYCQCDCLGARVEPEEIDGITVTQWRFKIDDTWTVPAVEFSPADAEQTTILVNDKGRQATSETVLQLLDDGCRVLAVDPFYFGESKIEQRDFLFALLVGAVGERPLGIQASQVAAIARWLGATHKVPVTITAEGPRSSTYALASAAIESEAIASVHVSDSLGTLKELIEQNKTVREMPEQFCFGLLRDFDVLQISALIAPRQVTFSNPSDRAAKELRPLKSWYKTFNIDHEPFE